MSKTPILYLSDGEEVTLPWKWIICECCKGHGKSSRYLGAFTGEQVREDPEFARDYMEGHYDRTCEECGGCGKTKEADISRMKPHQRKAWEEQLSDDANIRGIERMERLMEGGWREEGWFE